MNLAREEPRATTGCQHELHPPPDPEPRESLVVPRRELGAQDRVGSMGPNSRNIPVFSALCDLCLDKQGLGDAGRRRTKRPGVDVEHPHQQHVSPVVLPSLEGGKRDVDLNGGDARMAVS